MLERIAVTVTPFSQVCRILFNPGSSEAIVVDPGGEAEKILGVLAEKKLSCSQIWLTHGHLDHCGAVRRLKAASGAVMAAHADDAFWRSRVEESRTMFGLGAESGMEDCPEPEIVLRGGESLELGETRFEVLHTPGHSPGHVCFYQPDTKILLAGDILFAGSVGRTDLPGGDPSILMKSLQGLLAKLPPETRVLPGHGPETTLADESERNPFLNRGYL